MPKWHPAQAVFVLGVGVCETWGMVDIPPAVLASIDEALLGGNKIAAIKILREAAQCDLKDAKDAVERREVSLRQLDPSRFPAKKAGCFPLILAGGMIGAACWWV